MTLLRKQMAYKLSLFGWVLVAFGAALLVASGNAKPYVSLSDVPTGTPFPLFGGALVAVLLGVVVMGRLSRRAWTRTGRAAGLTPSGSGGSGKPELAGTVDGRTARMRTVTRSRGSSSSESGNRSTTYTVVEVDLTDPVADGLMIQIADGATMFGAGVQVGDAGTDVDGFGVLGAEEPFARAVVTDAVREELRTPSRLDAVIVGDVSDPIMDAFDESTGRFTSMLADQLEAQAEQGIFGDETTVRVQQTGVLLDGAELSRQIDALVAVAESYEAARADHGTGGRE
jgi:hypothetical protein